MRAGHAKARRFAVHQLHEDVLRPRDGLGERDARVVARLHFHALDELVDADGLARLDEHARAGGAPGARRHGDALLERELLVMQCSEHQVRRHQLGERCRLDALVRFLGEQHLTTRHVADDPGLAHDARRRRRRGMRSGAEQPCKEEDEADHQNRKGGADYKPAREPGTMASISTSPLPAPIKPRRYAAA